MVFPDLNDAIFSHDKHVKNYAGPFSRFLSALLDYFIFFPVVSFVMTILFRDSVAVISDILVTGEFTSVIVHIFIFYILAFTLLQTLFIYYYGATPGQSFFKIYIHFEEVHSNLFIQVWLRQIGFVVSLFLLGMPYLSVLYHSQRRTFYDRLSECDVLTRASSNEFYLREIDKRYIAAGVSTAICFFSTVAVISLIQSHFITVNQFYASSSRIPSIKKCFDLENQTTEQRMKTALALNVLDIIPDECVISEADALFGKNIRKNQQINSLAYYAKYLLAEKSVVSELAGDKEKYLEKACQSDVKSEFCEKGARDVASEIKVDTSEFKLNFLKKLLAK